jgi:hypothetical protein
VQVDEIAKKKPGKSDTVISSIAMSANLDGGKNISDLFSMYYAMGNAILQGYWVLNLIKPNLPY